MFVSDIVTNKEQLPHSLDVTLFGYVNTLKHLYEELIV